jgi:ribosomal protein S18 acetylase RimI-like enzyme
MSSREASRPDPPAPWRSEPTASDVEAVRCLVRRTGVFSAAEVAIAAELVEARLTSGQASGYHFVFADRADGLAAYTCFGPIPATQASFDLYWIAVRPDLQGQGQGVPLLAESERRIAEQGGRRVYVDTSSRREYAPAHTFYRRAGYREAARLVDFYAPGDAKLVFAKPLIAAHGSPKFGRT